MAYATLIKRGAYHDSVTLLNLARALRGRPGVREVGVVMGTPANRDLLAQASLLTAEAAAATTNDLVVVVDADSAAIAGEAAASVESRLAERVSRRDDRRGGRPRTIGAAIRRMPEANLALISVPGAFAAAEARRALHADLHVMLFSDNVSLEDEVALKRLAIERGLLLMGPDCGTAYVGGVPLGFANVVPRGRIGIVAASGTGLQQVAALLAGRGHGISHAIGVGGRDMGATVGGAMTLSSLDLLAADPATDLVIVIGKPPAAAVSERVRSRLRAIGKPAVICLLGPAVTDGSEGSITTVATLEDAALAADAILVERPWQPRAFSDPDTRRRAADARRRLTADQSSVLGLYAGGTLAHESLLILDRLLGPVASNLTDRTALARRTGHRVLDMGADEFTVGRAHPMLDPTARVEAIREAARRTDLAVLLLDVVLGRGAAVDPAGDLADAIRAARAEARGRGQDLAVVATVVGTGEDPQGLSAQIATLEAAGAWVLPSNAQAARAAACITGGDAVIDSLLGGPGGCP
jgi:succinyl-CoA synthetase alpha subunit